MQEQSLNSLIDIITVSVLLEMDLLTVVIHNILHKCPILLRSLPQFSCLKLRDFMLKMKGQVLFHIFSAVKSIDIPMSLIQMKMFRMVFNAFHTSGFLDSLGLLANLKQTID